jgi:alpha-beta hydrolase superfamily lysophospholipase
MVNKIVSVGLKALLWGFAGTGLASLLLVGLVAWPLRQPPELASISQGARAVDRSNMPGLDRFQARDGTWLAYRRYPPSAVAANTPVAILVHGSSGSSTSVHALAAALAGHGVETYAIDIRGHGGSGARGDIGHVGQLEEDMADLVALIRKAAPTAPLTLIGHSSGGGFALRVAGSSIQHLFARTILLAPFLGAFAPTNQPNWGGWANADIPRIAALTTLRGIGIDCCEALPVLAFAVPAHSEQRQVPVYTERLRSNFGVHPDFRTDLATASQPISIFAGAADELMRSDKYAEAVHAVAPSVIVKLIDGVDHMGIVNSPRAISMIAEDVAKFGASS